MKMCEHARGLDGPFSVRSKMNKFEHVGEEGLYSEVQRSKMNQFEHVQKGTPGFGAMYRGAALYRGKGHLNIPDPLDRQTGLKTLSLRYFVSGL